MDFKQLLQGSITVFVFGCPEYFTISYKINEETIQPRIKALTKGQYILLPAEKLRQNSFSAQPGEAKLKSWHNE